MVSSHTESFKIRSYECDLYGHVNNAVYLRYLQEANLAFTSTAGWPIERYRSVGWNWWPAWIDFEYLVSLLYGETVDVTVKAGGYDKAAYFQTYEFHKRDTGDLAARANTFSILRDLSGRPIAQIPSEIRSAVTPGDQAQYLPQLPPPVEAPPAPPGTFRMRKRVDLHEVNRKRELDPAVLLVYAGECGRQVVNAHGWPMERMLEEGFAILLKSNKIEYFQPAFLDDELEISSWVSNVRRVSAMRHYTFHRMKDGALLASIHALGVWVDLSSGSPRRAPAGFLEDFAPNISAGTKGSR